MQIKNYRSESLTILSIAVKLVKNV